jgi:hypothetical protein
MITDTPQFALPFRILGGTAQVNEQGSADDIAACVEAILRYPMGYRPEAPEFGRPRGLAFNKGDLELAQLAAQLARLEPRAAYLLEEEPEALEAAVRRVAVRLKGEML